VPIAAWHGFHVGGVTSYYQAGRDPAHARLSAGFVLLAHTLRAAIDEGAREYRFGRGAEDFKYRFTDDDPGLESVVLARTARGRAAVALARTAQKMRR
jgi:CelD/BcsL family acetyltransferase involved in cellulose biosynthesis